MYQNKLKTELKKIGEEWRTKHGMEKKINKNFSRSQLLKEKIYFLANTFNGRCPFAAIIAPSPSLSFYWIIIINNNQNKIKLIYFQSIIEKTFNWDPFFWSYLCVHITKAALDLIKCSKTKRAKYCLWKRNKNIGTIVTQWYQGLSA